MQLSGTYRTTSGLAAAGTITITPENQRGTDPIVIEAEQDGSWATATDLPYGSYRISQEDGWATTVVALGDVDEIQRPLLAGMPGDWLYGVPSDTEGADPAEHFILNDAFIAFNPPGGNGTPRVRDAGNGLAVIEGTVAGVDGPVAPDVTGTAQIGTLPPRFHPGRNVILNGIAVIGEVGGETPWTFEPVIVTIALGYIFLIQGPENYGTVGFSGVYPIA